jgi:hypothetical protein
MLEGERIVIKQSWLESEIGWGTRPDGYSLHLSDQDREKFIEEYWNRMPSEVPDEYSRPTGNPKLQTVPELTWKDLLNARARGDFGIRVY